MKLIFALEDELTRRGYVVKLSWQQFGKDMLYSTYGSTANCDMLLYAFGMIVGHDEDTDGWKLFFDFMLATHSSIDIASNKVITNQSKGCIC